MKNLRLLLQESPEEMGSQGPPKNSPILQLPGLGQAAQTHQGWREEEEEEEESEAKDPLHKTLQLLSESWGFF